MSEAKRLTDHDAIRRWAEARGARPSRVRNTTDADGGGVLRFDFGDPEEALEEISWDDFFRVFEDSQLALLEQDETKSGETSRFSKFVNR
ncbi:hypothetical protein [Brevundimonas sp.]|jgi:hypothetical protein|uniref:hypothetical protein n=1 Tax=Brevundimonas sp. TaxID=1871086 RepID=UPI00182570C3|nr:hypothetical protein [Brevundimonas sp.]MBA4808514.1 hypothetical protein [Brevundimonas sp.]